MNKQLFSLKLFKEKLSPTKMENPLSSIAS